MITLEGCSVWHGNDALLTDVDAEFRVGRCYAIVGRNGSGKSTLLKVVTGRYPLKSGQVRFDHGASQHSVFSLPELGTGLYPRFTAAQNLLYFARVHGDHSGDKVRIVARNFDIDLDSRHPVRRMSTGQRQRISLAIALATDAKAVIFDEPTLSLDQEMTEVFERAVLEMKLDGRLVLLATHDLRSIKKLADEALIVSDCAVGAAVPIETFLADHVRRTVSVCFDEPVDLNKFVAQYDVGAGTRVNGTSISIPFESFDFWKLSEWESNLSRIEIEEEIHGV